MRIASLGEYSIVNTGDTDHQIRMAAFKHLTKLSEMHDHLTTELIKLGFIFKGERIPLVNPQRGIFKPKQMKYLLSIRTVVPKSGKRIWYDDQREAHRQIYGNDESVEYSFMGQNPGAADNQWLREAYENQVPVVYFLGLAPGRYLAMIPTYISDWDAKALKSRIIFGSPEKDILEAPNDVVERRYALRLVKQRLHQSTFREAVILAYNGRCALSGLPEQQLLDAAHIISDKNELLGQPVVSNGLPLSKIHHAAFDRHFIGIDPDYKLHVSRRLLDQNDGAILEALKQLQGGKIYLPSRSIDYPDRDRLALRFEQFKAVA